MTLTQLSPRRRSLAAGLLWTARRDYAVHFRCTRSDLRTLRILEIAESTAAVYAAVSRAVGDRVAARDWETIGAAVAALLPEPADADA